MIAYFAPAPVSTGEIGESFCIALFRSNRSSVKGHLRDFFGICGAGAVDNREASGSGKIRLQGLEGVNLYCALIEASVVDVYFFGVGKKGVPVAAALWALW